MNAPVIHNVVQGSEEWHDLRRTHYTASQAPAVCMVSRYQTRNDIMRLHATGFEEPIDGFKQRIFQRGHKTEAACRPLAEAVLGAELYPATVTRIVDGLPLLASVDGMTACGKLWEHKLANDSLVDQVIACDLEEHYMVQLEQQMLVTGNDQVLFSVSDGEQHMSMYVDTCPDRRRWIIASWKQFARDLPFYEDAPKDLCRDAAVISSKTRIQDHLEAINMPQFPYSVEDAVKWKRTAKSIKSAADDEVARVMVETYLMRVEE